MITKDLTIRQEAACWLRVLCPDCFGIGDLYIIAHPGALDELTGRDSLPSAATRFFQSGRIKARIDELTATLKAAKEKEKLRIEADALEKYGHRATENTSHPDIRDYSQPKNQLLKLNELIDTSTDPADQLSAIKTLIDRQAYITPDKTPQGNQVRAYLPLRCNACPLYQEKKQTIKSKHHD